ncbi:HEAT repeat domain-containing protein [Salinadaptatus halalkaliphilus]|uniref:HEAT repeat domain-containing protein n=1 Tax=Salinadaptatus halalkaliphilus TaxID=2419781 RepID=A0A4S3TLH7_9EURY|nr:HEAT repeat domain-containing protein [Salinadaptatus halalkaliphilus]THE64460.1 HEAT repeat domain-containing protein [Salinadaptatus halalkaliphilus]
MTAWLSDVAIAIVGICLLVAAITLCIAVVRYSIDTRRETIRHELVPELFARIDRSDPDWEHWYESHSRLERYVIRRVVAQYLRQLRGREREQLLALATAVGIDDRAIRSLESRRLTTRLRGLIWLTLLEQPVSVDRLRATSLGHPSTRAAAARLLLVCRGSNANEEATSLLLWQNEERLSVFALDTLYRLNQTDASALTSKLTVDGQWWDEELLLQCLLVLGHCRLERRPALFEWLGELLEHDSPSVRAAALSTFERQGWQPAVRQYVDIERIISDPAPGVRITCYALLGRWGDPTSVEWLQYAVVTDPNDRCRVTAARTLIRIGASVPVIESEAARAADVEGAAESAAAIAWANTERNPPRRGAAGWV